MSTGREVSPRVTSPSILLSPPAEEQTLGILDYLAILLKFRWMLIALVIVGIAGALAISFRQKPTYRSSLQLEVQELNQNFMNIRDLDPSAAPNAGAPDSYVQLQAQVLQSDVLLGRVVKRLRLDERADYVAQSVTPAQRIATKLGMEQWLDALPKPQYAIVIRGALDLPVPAMDTPRERALRVASANLKVKAAAQSSLVDLYYTAPDRQTPAEFLNALAEEYLALTMEARWAGTERTADWLNKRLGEMRTNLEDSEIQLQDYARNFGMLYGTDRESVGEERLRQLQSELSKAQADRASLQAKYERVKTSSPEQLPQVLDDPLLRDYATRLADQEREYGQLVATMRPEHPQVRGIQNQINSLKKLIGAEVDNVLGRIHNEYETASRREALLTASYQQQFEAVSEQAGRSVPYHVLKRDVESKRQFYQDMLQKVNSAGVATAIRASNIHVVDPARESMLPYGPDLRLNLSLGTAGGFLLGIAACFLRESHQRRSRRLRQPGDAARYLNLPELGAIPRLPSSRAGNWTRIAGERLRPRRLEAVSQADSHALLNLRTPQMNDSFQAMLDSLMFADTSKPIPQVVAVSSALPLEGKTTVTTFLGLALADISKRVLLIDGDLRKPSLHEHFNVENGTGLTGLLKAEGLVDGAIRNAILRDVAPGVDLLPAGEAVDNIATLLAPGRLHDILNQLRSLYDTILIDTSPALLFPDVRVLGRHSDGVLLVVRSNQNSLEICQEAAQLLERSGNSVLGTILNDCRALRSRKSDRYYKRYAR